MLRLTWKLYREMCSSNIYSGISIEEFIDEKDREEPFHKRQAIEVPTVTNRHLMDENGNTETIFMLNVKKAYRIKVHLRHRFLSNLAFDGIVGIKIKPPDCSQFELEMKFTKSDDNEYEAVALLDLSSCSSKILGSVSPDFGSPNEKYIPLRTCITIKLEASDQTCFAIEQIIHVKMLAENDSLKVHRVAGMVYKKWVSLPLYLQRGIELVGHACHLTSFLMSFVP